MPAVITSQSKTDYLPSQEPHAHFQPVRFDVPPGACDCHAHIFGPPDRYPLDPRRSFDPPRAGLADYERMLAALGLQRAVIVHSSAYGTDLSATLDALDHAQGRWRAIALLDRSVTAHRVRELHAAGFRGARFNFIYGHDTDTETVMDVARCIAPFGWHVQMLVDARQLPELMPLINKLPVPIVIDHIGRMPTSAGMDDPGFQLLLQLLRDKRAWCKLSGANRMGDPTPPYATVRPFAKALIEAAPDQLVWGTDWPHVREPGVIPDDGDLLNLLTDWAPDPDLRQRILVDNPTQLYGF